MAQCTAPKEGHRTASGRANCPACGSGYGNGYSYYPAGSYSPPSYSSYSSGGASRSTGGGTSGTRKPKWSPAGSPVFYTDRQVLELTPVRDNVERRASQPDLRDIFLCHAWDDRQGAAKDLHDRLEALGVKVWFSEKDVALGSSLMREIDKGLVKSRVGIVMVTPAFLKRIQGESIADKELAALLQRSLLVPIVHNTTYEALRDISPLLGSRSGLNTAEESMDSVAAKLAELVAP